MIKGFIFDLDGVLVDTAKYHYQAWKRMANKLGFDFSEKENEQLKGVGRRDSLDLILSWGEKEISESEKERLMADKNTDYMELIKSMDANSALDGAVKFLEGARILNLKVALASSSKNAPYILELTSITQYFEAIVDGTQITNGKPDPEIFLTASQRLGLMPSELVVFEDARAGVDAAIAGGFRTVGIGDEKVLSAAEVVYSGLDKITPAQIINHFNF